MEEEEGRKETTEYRGEVIEVCTMSKERKRERNKRATENFVMKKRGSNHSGQQRQAAWE